MAIYKSGNPTLTEKIFDRSMHVEANTQGIMSVRGAINKFGFLLVMVIVGAAYTWNLFQDGKPDTMSAWMIGGLIGGLVCGFAISFKPNWAGFLSPAYALCQGLVLGSISVLFDKAFAKSAPGLIPQAVGLTFGVAISMFLLYNFRIIKVTQQLRSVVIGSIVGIMIFYVLTMLLGLFGVNLPFLYDSSALSIGISIFIVAIAAMKLLLDFDLIEQGAEKGAPKFMEWYCAFGLTVTLIWLYMNILQLLAKLANNK